MKLLGRKRQLTQEVIEEALGKVEEENMVWRVLSGLMVYIRGRKDEGRNVENVTKMENEKPERV